MEFPAKSTIGLSIKRVTSLSFLHQNIIYSFPFFISFFIKITLKPSLWDKYHNFNKSFHLKVSDNLNMEKIELYLDITGWIPVLLELWWSDFLKSIQVENKFHNETEWKSFFFFNSSFVIYKRKITPGLFCSISQRGAKTDKSPVFWRLGHCTIICKEKTSGSIGENDF